jgi:hypothetical protein
MRRQLLHVGLLLPSPAPMSLTNCCVVFALQRCCNSRLPWTLGACVTAADLSPYTTPTITEALLCPLCRAALLQFKAAVDPSNTVLEHV